MSDKKKSKFDKFCEKVESEFAALREATSIKDEASDKKKTPKLLSEQLENYRSQLEETHQKVVSLEEIVTPLLNRGKSDVFKKVIDFLFN